MSKASTLKSVSCLSIISAYAFISNGLSVKISASSAHLSWAIYLPIGLNEVSVILQSVTLHLFDVK